MRLIIVFYACLFWNVKMAKQSSPWNAAWVLVQINAKRSPMRTNLWIKMTSKRNISEQVSKLVVKLGREREKMNCGDAMHVKKTFFRRCLCNNLKYRMYQKKIRWLIGNKSEWKAHFSNTTFTTISNIFINWITLLVYLLIIQNIIIPFPEE